MAQWQVWFTDWQEYLAELHLARADMTQTVLRATQLVRQDSTMPIRSVTTVVTCLAGDQLLRLDWRHGQTWGGDDQVSADTKGRAKEAMSLIEQAARSLNLEVRAGILEWAGAEHK